MRKQFTETLVQYPNKELDLDIENPVLVAVIRIAHLRRILYSIIFTAEHTFTTLLIVTFFL